jgi:hypothetical protein
MGSFIDAENNGRKLCDDCILLLAYTFIVYSVLVHTSHACMTPRSDVDAPVVLRSGMHQSLCGCSSSLHREYEHVASSAHDTPLFTPQSRDPCTQVGDWGSYTTNIKAKCHSRDSNHYTYLPLSMMIYISLVVQKLPNFEPICSFDHFITAYCAMRSLKKPERTIFVPCSPIFLGRF